MVIPASADKSEGAIYGWTSVMYPLTLRLADLHPTSRLGSPPEYFLARMGSAGLGHSLYPGSARLGSLGLTSRLVAARLGRESRPDSARPASAPRLGWARLV